jgi:hypothetical protein
VAVEDEFIPEQGVSFIPPGQAIRRSTERLSRSTPEAEARTAKLIGAMQQFLDPQLSGDQSRIVKNVGVAPGLRGIFGGVVGNAQQRTEQQFSVGNRLAGLQGLMTDFTGFAPRGVSAADQTAGPDVAALLGQFRGLTDQFRFGGQAGRDFLSQLDPGLLGGFNNDITGIRDIRFRPHSLETLQGLDRLPHSFSLHSCFKGRQWHSATDYYNSRRVLSPTSGSVSNSSFAENS